MGQIHLVAGPVLAVMPGKKRVGAHVVARNDHTEEWFGLPEQFRTQIKEHFRVDRAADSKPYPRFDWEFGVRQNPETSKTWAG